MLFLLNYEKLNCVVGACVLMTCSGERQVFATFSATSEWAPMGEAPIKRKIKNVRASACVQKPLFLLCCRVLICLPLSLVVFQFKIIVFCVHRALRVCYSPAAVRQCVSAVGSLESKIHFRLPHAHNLHHCCPVRALVIFARWLTSTPVGHTFFLLGLWACKLARNRSTKFTFIHIRRLLQPKFILCAHLLFNYIN